MTSRKGKFPTTFLYVISIHVLQRKTHKDNTRMMPCIHSIQPNENREFKTQNSVAKSTVLAFSISQRIKLTCAQKPAGCPVINCRMMQTAVYFYLTSEYCDESWFARNTVTQLTWCSQICRCLTTTDCDVNVPHVNVTVFIAVELNSHRCRSFSFEVVVRECYRHEALCVCDCHLNKKRVMTHTINPVYATIFCLCIHTATVEIELINVFHDRRIMSPTVSEDISSSSASNKVIEMAVACFVANDTTTTSCGEKNSTTNSACPVSIGSMTSPSGAPASMLSAVTSSSLELMVKSLSTFLKSRLSCWLAAQTEIRCLTLRHFSSLQVRVSGYFCANHQTDISQTEASLTSAPTDAGTGI